jgi:hypothetical protein
MRGLDRLPHLVFQPSKEGELRQGKENNNNNNNNNNNKTRHYHLYICIRSHGAAKRSTGT